MTAPTASPAATDADLRRSRRGWIVFTFLLLAFAAIILATMHTGVAQDPRIANPNPGPAPYEISPFLEPVPFTIMSISQTLVLFGVLLWWSWRRRRLHWAAIIALGAIFTGLVDPLANWATFASLNPSVPHLPTDWVWVRIAPLSEPVSAFLGGYASYYLLIGVSVYWLSKQLVLRRASPGSMTERRPLLVLFISAWILSFPFNALFQLGWMQLGMLTYTQFYGPVIEVGHLQLPWLILLYDPFVYATIAIMCVRNDRDESIVLTGIAQRLPGRAGRPRDSSARQTIVAGVLMITSILVPISAFAVIRTLGLADHVVYDKWPYPETSVYDPYGDVEGAGKPGPFHR